MSTANIEVCFDSDAKVVSAIWVRKIVKKTLKFEKSAHRLVSILLTDDRRIRRINRKFLNHDYATDVISFGASDGFMTQSEGHYLGDVVVSVVMAKRKARELKLRFKEELARYLVHGLLHLLGYDDKAPTKRAHMHQRQEWILGNINLG